MRSKKKSIPVNTITRNEGIVFGKISAKDINSFSAYEQSHRDNYHSFFIQEKGTTTFEIDFQRYNIKPFSVIYIHPNQIHRLIAFEGVSGCGWSINNDNLNPEYLTLLEEITPTKPLLLKDEPFAMINEALSLCQKISERKHDKLHYSLLKGSCNNLVALIISQYLEQSGSTGKPSRFEMITKAFKTILESHFIVEKRPGAFAQKLNISTSYLNECVKHTTGYPVSHHIQQRIVLEAKRLLYHSDKSVKEIASELGYDDYPYFSRLFTKTTGMTALAFRNKNRD